MLLQKSLGNWKLKIVNRSTGIFSLMLLKIRVSKILIFELKILK